MRINYKLRKERQKTEKIEKSFKTFKMSIILILTSTRNKLIFSDNIFHSILNYKLMGPMSILRQPKEKRSKKIKIKKLNEISIEALKNELIKKNFFYFQIIVSQQCNFDKQFYSNISANMNKHIKTTKFLRKPIASTLLNSTDINGS